MLESIEEEKVIMLLVMLLGLFNLVITVIAFLELLLKLFGFLGLTVIGLSKVLNCSSY